MTPSVQQDYGRYLLAPSKSSLEKSGTKKIATNRVQELKTEDEIISEIKKTEDPESNQTLREAAIKRLSAIEIESCPVFLSNKH